MGPHVRVSTYADQRNIRIYIYIDNTDTTTDANTDTHTCLYIHTTIVHRSRCRARHEGKPCNNTHLSAAQPPTGASATADEDEEAAPEVAAASIFANALVIGRPGASMGIATGGPAADEELAAPDPPAIAACLFAKARVTGRGSDGAAAVVADAARVGRAASGPPRTGGLSKELQSAAYGILKRAGKQHLSSSDVGRLELTVGALSMQRCFFTRSDTRCWLAPNPSWSKAALQSPPRRTSSIASHRPRRSPSITRAPSAVRARLRIHALRNDDLKPRNMCVSSG
jgi:hypothetical protein